MQEYFEIGQIVNTFGVKGFVKVKPFTDDLERFEELESILVIKNKDMIEMKLLSKFLFTKEIINPMFFC